MKRNKGSKSSLTDSIMLQENKIKTKEVFMVMNEASHNWNSQITKLHNGTYQEIMNEAGLSSLFLAKWQEMTFLAISKKCRVIEYAVVHYDS